MSTELEMRQPRAEPAPQQGQQAAVALLQCLQARIEKLEGSPNKPLLKRIGENAGLIALFLGIVLSAASIRDALFTKPEEHRINAITQFNKAVSSAALIRQELIQLQAQTKDPAIVMAVQSAAMPRILNEIATARAILPDLRDSDVGIPQLLTLIFETFSAGDPAANDFLQRAVRKTDAPPFLRSEAKRYEGRYMFATGKAAEGRKSMAEAVALIPETAYSRAGRAWILSDWIGLEYFFGSCDETNNLVAQLGSMLKLPGIAADQRMQIGAGLKANLRQYQGQRCPMPPGVEAIPG